MSARPPLSLRQPPAVAPVPSPHLSDEESAVIDAIRGTAFGAIEVVVHQQRIVQVVKSEKTRFDAPRRDAADRP